MNAGGNVKFEMQNCWFSGSLPDASYLAQITNLAVGLTKSWAITPLACPVSPSSNFRHSRFFEPSNPLFPCIQFRTRSLVATGALTASRLFSASELLTHSRLFSTNHFWQSETSDSQSSDPKAESSEKAGPPLGILIGVVAGAVALAAIAALAAFLSRRSSSGASPASGCSRSEPESPQTPELETRDLTTMLGATARPRRR
jgi:hypothetical protein